MTKEEKRTELKKNIQTIATEEREMTINVITKLQGAAARENNEELLDLLSDIKWDFIGTRNSFA